MTFDQEMHADKKRVALTSVFAAIFLTGFKLIVGFNTGSLGILSEAVHSALDLGAAFLTYIAVRISDKPADADHPYGHGKIENISALLQTVILIGTCFFIIKLGVERIIDDNTDVEVTFWSFAVMGISILVDYTRSRALYRTAKIYRSQALEADALHFSTDIWSSMVVIFGLVLTLAGFKHGDSFAAIGVAVFVLYVGGNLLKKTIDALTDSIPKDIEEKIRQVMKTIEGIYSYRYLRVRQSGSKIFIDMYVHINRTVPFELAHHVTDEVENKISEIVPNADILIHMEPYENENESIIDKIRMIVTEQGLTCHNIRAQKISNGYVVDFHLECNNQMPFADAHEASTRIERKLKQKIDEIKNVKVHIEDARDREIQAEDITRRSAALIAQVRNIASEDGAILGCDDFIVMKVEGHKKLMFDCHIKSGLSLDEVHAMMTSFENRININLPEITQIVIHPETLDAVS
ncbi:cation diffusion facilitator family transporter [bacterium]|nr:cation diffusion facilitator family transporter [bacterium]